MISNKRDLSSNAGLIMAQAALNYANDKGWEITVAVCDRSGVLIAFMRTDDVIPAAVELLLIRPSQPPLLEKLRMNLENGWPPQLVFLWG